MGYGFRLVVVVVVVVVMCVCVCVCVCVFSWLWRGFCGRCLVVFGGLCVCVCVCVCFSCWWFLLVGLVVFLMGLQVGIVVAWWWLLAGVWWVKWDVSSGFLMGFVGAWLPRGRGRERETVKKE